MQLRFICAALLCVVVRPVFADQLVADTEPLSPAEQQKKFHLPPGFEIQLVACEPDVHKPMNMNFDSRGRLWVTHSLEYPFAAKSDEEARDAITIFSQFGPDGRAGKAERFAEHLNIPIGLLPLSDREALAWSIPYIYRLVDTNGDGVANERSPAFGPFDVRDTHGDQNAFTPWIDGWVYANHGFNNNSKVKIGGAGPDVLAMQSGNTYRFRADGSAIEQYSWGQVNPFGLSFDPLGNLYSADCHSRPVTMLLREGYYQSFGKPHDGLGYAPETTTIDHGGTGIAGVVYSTLPTWPAEYRDVLFVGNVITNRVHCDRLKWSGSSPTVDKVEDFLTCDDPWFRPVDLQQGPDGSLYVADFYNCIIGHYEVPLTHPKRDRERGRLWKITYRGTAETPVSAAPVADLAKSTAAELVALMGHRNLPVRTLATNTLIDRFPREAPALALQVLNQSDAPAAKTSEIDRAAQSAHAIWVLQRTGKLDEPLCQKLAKASPRILRVHLQKALGEMGSWEPWQFSLARHALLDSDAFVRRAAAEGLARHPQLESIQPLLRLLAETAEKDAVLVHGARIALRNQLRSPEVTAGLTTLKLSSAEEKQWMAFIASAPTDAAAIMFFDEALRGRVPNDLLIATLPTAAKFVDAARRESMIDYVDKQFADQPDSRLRLLKGLAAARAERREELGDSLRRSLVELIRPTLAVSRVKHAASATPAIQGNDSDATICENLKFVRDLRLHELADDLAVAARETNSAEVRLAACDALCLVRADAAITPLVAVLTDVSLPVSVREQSVWQLGRIDREEARAALVAQLKSAPGAMAVQIAASLASRKESAETLLKEIREGRASANLLREAAVADRLKRLGIADADQQIQELTADLSPADDRVAKLIADRHQGFLAAKPDATLGQAVFARVVCANCHRIGEVGKNIGPALDGIGNRGLERLLEDTLDPNRNVDPAFRTLIIVTDDGQIVTGFGAHEEGAVLTLHDTNGQPLRVPFTEIVERRVSGLSPMPANTIEQIPEQDFYHLIAFLLSQRSK